MAHPSELRRDYPRLVLWFERHPVLTALGFAAMFAGLGALVMAFLLITGVQ